MTKEIIRAEDAAEHRTDISGWVCKKCHRFWGKDERMARYCCATDFPCGCGGRRTKSYTCCADCRTKKDEARYQELLYKAEEIEYDGPFFIGNDLYFSLDEYFDDCESQGYERVEWAFVPLQRALSLDAVDIVEYQLENLCYGLGDPIEADGMEELKQAVEAFNKANEGNYIWEEHHAQRFRIPTREARRAT